MKEVHEDCTYTCKERPSIPLTLFFLPYCCMKSVKDVCSAGHVKNNIEEISIKICLKLYTYNLQARVPV